MKGNTKTKDKTFSMRCDQKFLDSLTQLSEDMGVSKSQVVEITIAIYPDLVRMYNKLDKMIIEAKQNL
jgi:hypothetical protein